MKKLETGVICLLAISMLTGCSSSGELIKSYSNTALNTKSLIIHTDTDDNHDFFAKDLVVFPKSSTVNPAKSDEDAAETTEEETKTADETETDEADETDETKSADETEESLSENDSDREETGIDAKTGLLAGMDSLSDVYAKDIYTRVYPASLTKIMTALIVCEQCNVLDRMRIPPEAVGIEGSSMYLREVRS